jgi:hypothetical protein
VTPTTTPAECRWIDAALTYDPCNISQHCVPYPGPMTTSAHAYDVSPRAPVPAGAMDAAENGEVI